LTAPARAEFEFGAKAYGPQAAEAAAALTARIAAWDAHGRDIEPGGFTFWPAGDRGSGFAH
jgi:hypothetical protein